MNVSPDVPSITTKNQKKGKQSPASASVYIRVLLNQI